MMGEKITKRFGAFVRRLREANHITQEAFAERAGIDRSYQGRIERAEAKVSLPMVENIAKAFRLSPGELLVRLEQDGKT